MTGSPRAASSPWAIVVAAFITFAVSAGVMHSYPVFFVAFLTQFGWTRAETSIAYSISQLLSGAVSPAIGVMVDRLGPRLLVLLGGVLLAVGLALSAEVSALWHLVALYGVVMTVGANCLGLVVLTPLVSRRFVEKRGFVLSIVQSANGFGRAASAPTVQFLISTIGWRRAYVALAAFMAVLVVPLGRFFRTDTELSTRQVKSAASTRVEPLGVAPSRDWTVAEAMATPHFWLLLLVYLLTGLGSFFVSLHQLAFAADKGFDTLHAASILGMGSFLSVIGTIFTGTISDYIGREVSAIIAYGISIIGVIAALFITSADQTWLLWIHACFFGLTWGARGPMITAKTADLFQGRHLGAILKRDLDRNRRGGRGRRVGEWADLRRVRQLPDRVHTLDRVVPRGLHRLLVPAPSAGRPEMTRCAVARTPISRSARSARRCTRHTRTSPSTPSTATPEGRCPASRTPG